MVDQALATIDMMDFEGKEKVRETIRNNGTLYEQLMQAQQTSLQLAQVLAEQTGDARPLQALQTQMGGGQVPAPEGEVSEKRQSAAEKAKQRSRDTTAVR